MKVLIVDDSALMRAIIREALTEQGFMIVGEAGDGRKAVAAAERLKPDLIIMDFNMPLMNGVEATRAIMDSCPAPIVVFSNEVDSRLSLNALQAGAMEVVAKPDIDQFNNRAFLDRFLATLRAAAGKHKRRGSDRLGSRESVIAGDTSRAPTPGSFDVIVIGASTGGPAALRQVLSSLPPGFPLGIAIVQHIEARFAPGFASWLDDASPLKVRLATSVDAFTPGEVIVAPGDRHLVCTERRLRLDDGPKVGSHRPAVDRLFATVASCYGRRTLGVLLTGMGADGADGCVAIREAGGTTLVQDESTSFIYGMPRAAAERGGASRVLPLDRISPTLVELVKHHG